MDRIKSFLIENNICYSSDYNLKHNSYSKLGHSVQLYIMPKSEAELIHLIGYLSDNSHNYYVVGETTNIIFLDSVKYGIFVSTSLLNGISFKRDKVEVQAGRNTIDFIKLINMSGVTGYEGLEGIPGSLGGAIYMNAGAYRYEISDNIDYVNCIDKTGKKFKFTKDECKFGNRNSIFKNNKYIIVSAVFNLKKGKRSSIYRKVERFHIARHSYQEFVYPNLGSIFATKNIYKDLSRNSKFYKIKYYLIHLLFYNRIMRFIRRKRPNNKLLNQMTIKHFGIKNNGIHSIKTLNCLTNKDDSTNTILKYISEISCKLEGITEIENIIFQDNILEVLDEKEYNTTLKLLKK